MSEQPSMRNELSGTIGGHAVQAGTIHGDVVLSPSPLLSAEQAEFEARWRARAKAQLDAEDAEHLAAELAYAKYLARERRWFYFSVFLVLLGLALLLATMLNIVWFRLLYPALVLLGLYWGVPGGYLLYRAKR
ncbi:hypothetical protein ACWEFL_34740 [Streptomyces sp. NPDC004838]